LVRGWQANLEALRNSQRWKSPLKQYIFDLGSLATNNNHYKPRKRYIDLKERFGKRQAIWPREFWLVGKTTSQLLAASGIAASYFV
jgi:hypothetical protein